MDCKVKRTKKNPNDYDLSFSGLTRGSIMALKNALEVHASSGSAIANDILTFLIAGIRDSDDMELVRSVLDAPVLEAAAAAGVDRTSSSIPPAA